MTDLQRLEKAIRRLHRVDCTHQESVPVRERVAQHEWEGVVEVFTLVGHPDAALAYAWSREAAVGGGRTCKTFTAVLGVGPIQSARDAVRAVLTAERTPKSPQRAPRGRPPTTSGPDDAA
jgi:hypothetical protein